MHWHLPRDEAGELLRDTVAVVAEDRRPIPAKEVPRSSRRRPPSLSIATRRSALALRIHVESKEAEEHFERRAADGTGSS